MTNQNKRQHTLGFSLAALTLMGVFSAQAEAQVIHFSTYNIGYLSSSEGEYRPPVQLSKIKADELDKFWSNTKEEKGYMEEILSDYVGKKKTCLPDLYFLPDKTESAFRASEKKIVNGVVNTGFTSQVNGTVTKYKLKKSSDVKKFSNGSVSLYLYEAYSARTKKNSVYIYAFTFSDTIKQGNLMICSAFI